MSGLDRFSDLDRSLGNEPAIPKEPQKKAPSDIEVLRQEFRAEQEKRDQDIRAMISGVANASRPTEPEPVLSDEDFLKKHLPDDVDPGVVDALMPILGAQRDLIERAFATRYGPVAEAVERDENIKVIGQRVDGFEEILPEVQKLYEQLPPEVQAEYDTRVGIEALARRVLQDRRGSSDMSGMAHAADPNTPPARDPGEGPTEADVWDLSDEDFDAYVNKVKMGGTRRR